MTGIGDMSVLSLCRVFAVSAICITALALLPVAARADLADTIEADLAHAASGVPSPQVTVGSPGTYEAMVGPGTALMVRTSPNPGEPLAGLLVPEDGQPLFTTTTPKLALWELAIMEAAKHAVIDGSTIESVSVDHDYVGEPSDSDPDFVVALPPYQYPPLATGSMTRAEVRAKVRAALPDWALISTIKVVDDAVSERVVSVSLALPPDSFRVIPVSTLIDTLLDQQVELAEAGANIGRVTVEIYDPATKEPLYAAGADAFLGFSTSWHSPLVKGLIGEPEGPVVSIPDETGNEDVDQVLLDIEDASYEVEGQADEHLGPALEIADALLKDVEGTLDEQKESLDPTIDEADRMADEADDGLDEPLREVTDATGEAEREAEATAAATLAQAEASKAEAEDDAESPGKTIDETIESADASVHGAIREHAGPDTYVCSFEARGDIDLPMLGSWKTHYSGYYNATGRGTCIQSDNDANGPNDSNGDNTGALSVDIAFNGTWRDSLRQELYEGELGSDPGPACTLTLDMDGDLDFWPDGKFDEPDGAGSEDAVHAWSLIQVRSGTGPIQLNKSQDDEQELGRGVVELEPDDEYYGFAYPDVYLYRYSPVGCHNFWLSWGTAEDYDASSLLMRGTFAIRWHWPEGDSPN